MGAVGFAAVPLEFMEAVVPFEAVADVAELGTLLTEAEVPVVADGAGIIPGGHGLRFTFVFVVVVLLMPGVAAAPAGTLELGFVVDVADAGVLPIVLVVPFC